MSTELNNNKPGTELLSFIPGLKIAIVVAEWNRHITEALLEGARSYLYEMGYTKNDVSVYYVPGTVELTFAASHLIKSGKVSSVIVLGCVIRGDTTHYDYVCKSVTDGVTQLNLQYDVPVIFGVLTVENEQQALDRAGGKLGNKGTECAACAIKMCDFILQIQN